MQAMYLGNVQTVGAHYAPHTCRSYHRQYCRRSSLLAYAADLTKAGMHTVYPANLYDTKPVSRQSVTHRQPHSCCTTTADPVPRRVRTQSSPPTTLDKDSIPRDSLPPSVLLHSNRVICCQPQSLFKAGVHPQQPFPHRPDPVGSMFQVHSKAGPDLLKPYCTPQILFKAGVHPEQPANTLDKEAFDAVWQHSVLLLQRGFTTGSILTVDPEEAAVLGARCQQDPLMSVGQFGLSSLCKPTSHPGSLATLHAQLQRRRCSCASCGGPLVARGKPSH